MTGHGIRPFVPRFEPGTYPWPQGKRVAVSLSFDDTTFDQFLPRLRAAEAERGWIVLAGHDVGLDRPQSVVAETLDAVCRYCAAPDNGVWIDTVAAVAAHIRKTRGDGWPEAIPCKEEPHVSDRPTRA